MSLKVLWITNIPIGAASTLFGIEANPYGGWLDGALTMAAADEALDLTVAFPTPSIEDIQEASSGGVRYLGFPVARPRWAPSGHRAGRDLGEVLDRAAPDLVHVFGTELPHSNAVVRLCQARSIPIVVQLQGLMAAISQHSDGWLPDRISNGGTPLEWVRRTTLRHQSRNYARAATLEADTIRRVRHVIGRTTFDRALSAQLNPDVEYFACNESLREPFYGPEWRLNSCRRHSILMSQASRPYKGAHQLLEALPTVVARFPDVQLRIAGPNGRGSGVLRAAIRSTYSRYLSRRIRELGLEDKVAFVGPQDAEAMLEVYLRAHVFVSCSSIENESNSLSEAKVLGMPVVASFVGGVTDRIQHGVSGFAYQGDATYMLAHYICEVFADDDAALRMGAEARREALVVNDRRANHSRLVEIYQAIIKDVGAPTTRGAGTHSSISRQVA